MTDVRTLTHEQVMESHPDLVAAEMLLEEEAHAVATERADRGILSRGMAEASPTAKRALSGCVVATAALLDEWLAKQAKISRKSPYYQVLRLLEPEQLALIVARQLINASMKDHIRLASAATKIGEQVRAVMEYQDFKDAHGGSIPELKGKTGQAARRVYRSTVANSDFEGIVWDSEFAAGVGTILALAFCDATGLYAKMNVKRDKKTVSELKPTLALELLVAEAGVLDALLMPMHYPMIIPPKPWTDTTDGGYLSREQHSLQLVKASNPATQRQLEATDLSQVIRSVNLIQATPWRVNLDVLKVIQALHIAGTAAAGLEPADAPVIPENPWGKIDAADWPEFKAANSELVRTASTSRREGFEAHGQWCSARLKQEQQLKIAERFCDEPAIYFPHTLDFRSRVYPAAGLGTMNPQADDTGKALLQFARGKRIGPEGGRWLGIHLANCWGFDKAAMDDREMWAHLHSEAVLAYVADPLANVGWMDADKPFGFLAACYEWAGYLDKGHDHISHIPVAMDGSCSGLQHFAAMLKDQKTAEAVNVVQTGSVPADVYTLVLNKVIERLAADADGLAKEWAGVVNRKICKPPVMTTPYGVGSRGIIDQIAGEATKQMRAGKMPKFSVSTFNASKYLGPLVEAAIGTETAAAGNAMGWLKKVASVAGNAGCPVRWSTLIGFTGIQNYQAYTSEQVHVAWAGNRHRVSIQKPTFKLDGRRQNSGMAPNFVHSQDACHLLLTVNECNDNGIEDFAMIHDSFGAHPSDVPVLNAVLREVFIDIYSGDVLMDLYIGMEAQLPAAVFAKLPLPPTQGTLDLAQVRESEFFFS